MNARDRPRFDIDSLRELAGAKAYARGEAYHRDGQVVILSNEPRRILAQVTGTEEYRTELTGQGKKIGGTCSCPAFDDWGFCKHLVAVALAANAAGTDAAADGVGALARIREHLTAQGIDALVDMIVGMAERDPALFRKLDMSASLRHADDKTIGARLRMAIDTTTHTSGYVEYRAVFGWAEGVNAALDGVADLVSGGNAGLALSLATHAIERIEAAIDEMDDSDGHCSALLARAGEIHLAAVRAARPDPIALARDLFDREMESEYDTFDGAAAVYAETLGDDGLAEYHRLAQAAWAELPQRSGAVPADQEHPITYDRLANILDAFSERAGDVEARIALRSKDLSCPLHYLRLAEFCLAQGREAEALRKAEEGLWVFEDARLDERLLFFTVDLLVKTGRKDDALARLWQAFETAPSLALYTRLRALGGKAARDRALTLMQAQLGNQRAKTWHYPADLLIHILSQEKLFDAAWDAVRKHGASMGLREALARTSERTHPREALAVYAERVEALANSGGDPAYEAAVDLITRMAGLRSAPEHAAYLAAFRQRFGRRRNLMKMMA